MLIPVAKEGTLFVHQATETKTPHSHSHLDRKSYTINMKMKLEDVPPW